MKSVRFVTAFSAIATLFLVFSSPSATAQDRSVETTHVPAKVSSGEATPVAPLDDTRHLQLALSLQLRDEAGLNAFLKDVYDPQSPNFHHYLSVQEFTDRFSPTQQDYDTVVQWAQDKGLQVTETSPNRLVVNVDGSVNAINRAFKVVLKQYQDNENNRTFHAPDREPTVDLTVPLLAVSGLDNAVPLRRHYSHESGSIQSEGSATETPNPVANITGSGPGNTYLPSDMRKAYYGNGPLTGAGQTVAIFSFDGYIANDINVYYSSTGMTSTVPVNNVYVAGYNGACFGFNANGTINPNICDDGEQILDIVNVIGMAPGLTQVLFYEGNSATSVLNKMASDNIAKSISSSWGGGDFGSASVPAFLEFQAQGQSYLNATGDSGQFNSSTYFPPSVDPNITQVGGTNLVTTGAGGPWASEVGWPDSGGGFFAGTPIPSYQQQAGVINSSNKGSTTLRNAPDVAAEANFDNTTVINGVFKSGYGGTSFAAPRWAGLIALANQQAVANGHATLGFLNPSIYTIGLGSSYAADFHDITSGINRPTAGAGTGFNAVAGYDLITGWGSPIGPALIATLTGTTPTPDYSLAAAPSSVSIVQGGSGTSTITVTPVNGFTGSVSLAASGLPSGVTASFSPTSTTGTSTLTLTASGTATVGTATVTVTGTSGSLTHTTTVALTVTAAPTPNYTLSASPNSLTIVQGAVGSSTITVTPTNGFAGAVSLTASGLPSGVTASFSPSSATSTSTLTLTASSTAALGTVTVTVTGVSGSLTHTTTVALTIASATAPDFSLSASPSSVSVAQSGAATSTITISATGGFTGTVSFQARGLPAGVTAAFSPVSGGTSILTLTAASTATLGTVSARITGISGSLSHTINVGITVTPPADYSLSASPGSVNVVQGASGTSTVSLAPINGFNGSVALSASGLPAGVTASFSPASTTASSVLTLTASGTAAVGSATVTITGVSGSLTHTTTVALTILPAPDYSLSASPSSLSVVQGTNGTSTISVAPLNGFNSAVSLSASGLPAGVTASFSPASTTGTSVLTLTAGSTATVGTATVTITGVSGSLSHTTTVALTITPAPDYSLAASPSSVSIVLGGASGSSTISVTPLNAFNGSVDLSASGLPAGVTASFSPASTTGTSVLTLNAGLTATVGTATVTITGVSGSLSHTTTITLTVTPAPDYSLAASPSSLSVVQGANGSSTISVTPLNAFNGSVDLSASGLPAGVTASFSPASTTGTSVLTLTAGLTATVGTATVTITGVSGSLTHTTTVTLTVVAAPDYSLSASPSSLSIVQGGGSGSSTITVAGINGFNSSVSLSASGLPSGVTASFSPASTTGTSALTLTAAVTATVGTVTVAITGVSGSLTHTTNVTLTVTPAPDYSLSASPSSLSIVQGASGTSTISVAPVNGFNGLVSLSASGVPPGVTATFSPASTTGTSQLTLVAASSASTGLATITITGVSGSLIRITTVTLTVTPAQDYSLSASPGSVSIVQGASGSSTISVSPVNGFNGLVSLSASGLPAGVTASFSPSSTTGTSVLTLVAGSTATVGTATVTITGVSGSLTRTTTVTLTITAGGAPDFAISASPASVTINRSGTVTSTITIAPSGGFTGLVSFQARGLPVGVTASFSPSSTNSSSVMTLTASSTATLGTAVARITGVSGSLAHTVNVTIKVQ